MTKKNYLRSQLKSKGSGYLFFFFFGAHFAYLGKWGTQFLFWFTLYGLGIWGLVELFLVGGRVDEHNRKIYSQLDKLEKEERNQDLKTQLDLINSQK